MAANTPTILLLGTCDTKLPELLYTKAQIESTNATVLLMDISRNPTTHKEIAIPQSALINAPLSPTTPIPDLTTLPRAEYITTLTPYATKRVTQLHKSHQIHGILAIGGSCGTSLAAAVMRDALPVGFPKLIVSTMAAGDVGPYIGETDISMMYSVVDIAGRNRVLEGVLDNAAGGIAGMANAFLKRERGQKEVDVSSGVKIGISMFGVTTPGVTRARERLEEVLPGCEVYVFHATGSGGRALERLVREGQIDAVLDLTTTEIADEVVGGVLSAGAGRLTAATVRDIPRVVSVGACDMVNFGEVGSVPAAFREAGRLFYEHNATVTLMRTTKKECVDIGKFIAANLSRESRDKGQLSRTKVILPVGGVSMLDVPGQAFQDPEADEVLFSTLERELEGSGISIVRDSRDINDPSFAVAVADELVKLIHGE
ncbi:Uncharacterized protein family UPF0261 [Penicillium expansum]|uniref:Uncharacterized protein family UPF0261 n=1 Tax=Penicillium expansum TaxID=27334 RepID=A0A0A2JHF9_PENEN|nr:Uncharacterized protein family UPF0261 [Penicillium expansum]KAJ5490224.1 hypothetical protein N7453_011049 [Penicillium expansum]KGO54842.1 Uncharacterized protein family UPF0261 [Penicillium expansum]